MKYVVLVYTYNIGIYIYAEMVGRWLSSLDGKYIFIDNTVHIVLIRFYLFFNRKSGEQRVETVQSKRRDVVNVYTKNDRTL